jgi:diguanylate cyclase (GGDEF)-like protein
MASLTVISIKKLLNADPEAAGSVLRAAQILLQGIGDHAIRCDPDEYTQFHRSIEQTAAALADCADAPETLILAGGAIRLLEDYNRRTVQQLRLRSTELQGMVKMLTVAIGEISAAGEESVGHLRDIEGLVSSVTQIEDVRAVRAQLSVCLDEIRKEARCQKVASSSVIGRLKQDLERVQADAAADALTGLPVRARAVELISTACESEQPAFVAVMVIDRFQAVNAALGADAGDQLLRYFSGYVQRSLPPGDQLFRWTGASFLALLLRSAKIETVREEIKYLLEQKLEFKVRTATRSIRLPVTARWTLFPTMASSRLLIEKIDAFASPQPIRDQSA